MTLASEKLIKWLRRTTTEKWWLLLDQERWKGQTDGIRGLDHVRNAGGPASVVWSGGVIRRGPCSHKTPVCTSLSGPGEGGVRWSVLAHPGGRRWGMRPGTRLSAPGAARKGPLLSAEYTLSLVITENESSSDPPPRGGTSGSICEWGWRLKQWPRAACVPWQRFPDSAGSSEKGAKGKTQGDGTPRTWFNTRK